AVFQSSSWIWQDAQGPTGVPGGNWAFRKTLPISTAPAREAIALLTVDNGFQLYHNGQFIAENSTLGWQMATAVHVSLDPNSNVFAIQAHNSPSRTDSNANSAAGLLASIQILYTDGTTTTISSDATWRVTQPVPDGFQSPSFNDAQWQSAIVAAAYGSGPWGYIVIPPQSSSWIWLGNQALTGVPRGDWAFRISLPTSTAPATMAVIVLTVDDTFVLYHNGRLVANSTALHLPWELAMAFQISLDPNSNVFAIHAHNSAKVAGLLSSIQISYADGSNTTISSDSTWRVTKSVPDGFQSPSFDDSQWAPATVLTKYGLEPW
ncbi:hypothetical protein BD779DRAFT_1387952, partial [Infundibulicybe gibba]